MIQRISMVTMSDGSHHWLIRMPRWYVGWLYVTRPRLRKFWGRLFTAKPGADDGK